MKLTEAKKRSLVFCAFSLVILIVCFILIAHYCGFQHEPQAYRVMLVTLLFVVVSHLLFWEPIRFIVLAIDHATWPSVDHPYRSEKGPQPNLFTYLKTRLSCLRSEVIITEEHRNEALNQKYKNISTDLWLYGSSYLALLLTILAMQDQSLYYATNMMGRLFNQDTPTTMGLSNLCLQYETYMFIAITLVEAFNANSSVYGHDGWYAMDQWKMLGAIRLRQLRTVNKKIGLGTPKWDSVTYAPGWKLPYQHLHYTDRFWRVFDPFKPMVVEPTFINGLLLNFRHFGEFMNYPELGGYMALMMRPLESNRMQLKYLDESKWLNRNTAALFIDFSLYNVDANVFAILTLRVENSPFGPQLPHVGVDCVRILALMDFTSWYQRCLMVIYFISVLQFMRVLLENLWYDPAAIRKVWNLVDVFICLLNVFLLILCLLHEILTTGLLMRIQTLTMDQFLETHRLLRLHHIISANMGLLIAITTLRLWKVLQFAFVFQHFAQTLSSAWKGVLSLGVAIVVALMGIGIALAVPNGNNAVAFRHIFHAVTTCLWYSVGFNEKFDTKDLFHGGKLLGMLLFLLMVFIVAIILINVFASVIYDYLRSTRQILREKRKAEKISFWQFLKAEYGETVRRFLKCFFQQKYYRRRHTVAENVAMKLDRQEQKELLRSRGRNYKPKPPLTDEEQHADYLRRVHRSISLEAVLQVQLELLKRYLLGDEYGNVPTPPESDVDSVPVKRRQ
ncbi:polycystin-2 [Drosophila kikkawai]|uniref:Polycystin-2 n=1 Tax=Drosophila kikkawai TaxID=30033 RepID=A0A6P4IDD4_DROKI|nr:polycystin-2 [Drosophila kikkawai]